MWLVLCRTMWLLSLTQIQENGHQTRSASTQCSLLPGRGAQNIVCLIVYTELYIYLTMWYMDIMWCGDILFCMGTVVLYMTMSPSFCAKTQCDMFLWPCCTWALFGDYTQCGHVYVTIILYVDIAWCPRHDRVSSWHIDCPSRRHCDSSELSF